MEYAGQESLLRFVVTNGYVSENQARHYFAQIISVLEYLHGERRVCHRDVKSENMLLDRHNNIRVIDFGLSNQFTASHPLLTSACGSPPYVSPEMAKGKPYSQPSDIWSAGVLLYSITTGIFPFDDDNLQALLRKIVTQEVVYPSFLSPSLIDLLRRMLTKDPELRITLPEIREHDWFSETQSVALFALDLRERIKEGVVESEIVEQMTELGIETTSLRQQLLLGVFTELTAMYRMLRRERLTDTMNDLIRGLPGQSLLSDEFPRGLMLVKWRGSAKPRLAARSPMPLAIRPARTGQAGPGTSTSPSPAPLGSRRFPRPVTMTRNCSPR
jgi:serine/threonine protein kinase